MNNTFYDRYHEFQASVSNPDAEISHTSSELDEYLSIYLPDSREASILDIGCGWGKYLAALRKRGYTNLLGVDISHDQIQFGHSIGIDCINHGEIKELLSSTCKYDCIFVMDVFEHLELQYLTELIPLIFASLKDGGKLIVQVPNGHCLMNFNLYGDITHLRGFNEHSLTALFNLGGGVPVAFIEGKPSKSFRAIIWKLIVRPLINFTFQVIHGRWKSSVFSPNIIAVATRGQRRGTPKEELACLYQK